MYLKFYKAKVNFHKLIQIPNSQKSVDKIPKFETFFVVYENSTAFGVTIKRYYKEKF